IFPHRYSKLFYDFWWSQKALWKATMLRLEDDKDNFVLISGDTGCQPAGSKVLMSDGEWKNIEDIKVGDEVISPQKNGSNIFSRVKWVNEWECPETYDVVQNNKAHRRLYSCSNNHKVPFYHKFHKRGTLRGKRYYKNSWWGFKEYKAEIIEKMYKESFSHQNIGFSSFEIEKFKDKKNCEIEPYTLGVILGDGHYCKQLSITTEDKEIIKEVEKFYPIMSIHNKKNNSARGYMFSLRSEIARLLQKHGLKNKKSGDKFIPKEAMLSDSNYRKRLLAGLINTDGYYSNGGYDYVSKSKKLIEDIRDLVYSIGGRCGELREVSKGIKNIGFRGQYYSISFYLGNIKLPLLLKRKQRSIPTIYLEPNRIAITTKKSTAKRVYGFELESESSWYITDNWMVTHNSGKSHLVGTFAFNFAEKQENIIAKDGSKMFPRKENFIIDPEEFAYKMILREGQFLWGDEFRRGSNRRSWYSPINKAITDRKNTNRKLGNTYFVCVPFEKEFDPSLASHLTLWIWVRRGVGEIYCKRSGVKGGTGLNIAAILEREAKYLKENPQKTIVNPTIHPEYVGRIAFSKLSEKNEKKYKELVKLKRATGDLTDEEKLKYGIKIERKPEDVVKEVIQEIKDGKITSKKELWESIDEIEEADDKKLRTLNFYLKLEGYDTFNKLFEKKKLSQVNVEW
ncbi:hypothetical protein KAT51_00860, partial [bacterium]|nr:hypothetical protein [bacterium]